MSIERLKKRKVNSEKLSDKLITRSKQLDKRGNYKFMKDTPKARLDWKKASALEKSGKKMKQRENEAEWEKKNGPYKDYLKIKVKGQ